MAGLQTFYKIKDLHEREKKEKQKDYQHHVEVFEDRATRLCEALKQKESAEEQFQSQLSTKSIQAMTFIQHQHYIDRLEQKINELQPEVQKARTEMQVSQQKLTDAHIQVKKYEKLIENKLENEKFERKQEENKQMDELSMNQYLNSKNR
ncbi:flagellar export protein FliJ [Halobacillus yeomjeoni]|uniref:flagellar export protein FliJ n=1 Tax=Halobacillus yeomjeoni TaxID=311194 RepID=UPI001CD1D531|nr:flagellar export protein FliJ [Halobacillus yeomjeoni]MCA0983328.1 flagellar export protein FliJ [Halobacillus yeomjeoni]